MEPSHYSVPVVIWDDGGFELLRGSIKEGRLEFRLKGKKLKGVFAMARMSGKEKEWLLMKKRDEFAEDDFKIKMVLTPSLLKKLKTKVPPCEAS